MQARQMLIDGEIQPGDWMQTARFIALMSQAEGVKQCDLLNENNQKYTQSLSRRVQRIKSNGKLKDRKSFVDELKRVDVYDTECYSHLEKFIAENYAEHLMLPDDTDTEIPDDLFPVIAREHQRIQTMTTASSKYWFLEEFSTLKGFGEERFEGTLISETNSSVKVSQPRSETIQISVSPQGLNVRKIESCEAFSIPFSAVESAKSLRRCFHLCYLDEDFTVSNLVVKFSSHRIAGTLYRSLTEKHAFYSCETVHKNVETQFIRDLKVNC